MDTHDSAAEPRPFEAAATPAKDAAPGPSVTPPAPRRGLWRRLRASLTPGRRAWRGATRGVLGTSLALLVAGTWDNFSVSAPNWAGLLVVAAVAAASFLLALLLLLCLRALATLPWRFLWAVLAAPGLAFGLFLGPLDPKGTLALVLLALLWASLAGAALATLVRRGAAAPSWAARLVGLAGAAVGGLGALAALAWLASPGRPAEPVTVAAWRALTPPLAPIAAEDPGRPGPYRVLTLTYGSGSDRRRPEFGARAALKTRPFDGSPFVERWSGAAGRARTRYWGFDAHALPLQGRVWYPDGAGPFPLVLCVHGNHTAEDSSDAGYAYLGEQLASRGFIFVSVDENFLNGALIDLLGVPSPGLDEENDLRGVLLLEHLRQWRDWNTTAGPAQPFHGRVDLERVALIGHSRGGEAVAVAAAFNPLPAYPDDATRRFDYGFGVRAVVAIAPVDGQYHPAGTDTRPLNVDYLTLHGSMDGDVRSFHGSRVFERVRFDDGRAHFKAGVWVHGANHGQFNTRWGRNDAGGFAGLALRRAAILPEADQQRVARVFIGAFLEASLHERAEYRALFRDRRAGGGWLPETVYLQQYADTDTRVVAGFDEDLDTSTTTLAGGSLAASGLSDWKEREVRIKWGTLDTRAVIVGWDAAARAARAPSPSFDLRLPDQGLDLRADAALTFHLADTGERPTARDASGVRKDDARTDDTRLPREPIDLTLELTDRAGAVASLPLSRVAGLQPRLEAQVTRLPALDPTAAAEVVLTYFELPLRLFVQATPALDPTRLARVRFVFDRTPAGVLVLDDVGFRQPPSAAPGAPGSPAPRLDAPPAPAPRVATLDRPAAPGYDGRLTAASQGTCASAGCADSRRARIVARPASSARSAPSTVSGRDGTRSASISSGTP